MGDQTAEYGAGQTLRESNLGVTSYPCCGARRQRSANVMLNDIDGFADTDSTLTLSPGCGKRQLSAQSVDAESGEATASGDDCSPWYDLAMVVEDLRVEFKGALAQVQSEYKSLAHHEAALRVEHRVVFQAALVDVSTKLQDDIACTARELRAGDAALGERIVDLSARSAIPRSKESDVSRDEALLEVLSAQIHEKSLLFEEDNRALETQLAAIRAQLAGERVVREEFEASVRAEIAQFEQLAMSRSEEDCASQALLVDAAVATALAEKMGFLDASALKQQKLMDDRFAEHESSSNGRAGYIEGLVERWVGEENKARDAQASSTRASLDEFAERVRREIAQAQDELQQTVTKDVQNAIAFHRQDISKSIEDLRVMLSAARQTGKMSSGALPSVPESLAESAAEAEADEPMHPTEVEALHKSSSSSCEKLRAPLAPRPASTPTSSAPPPLLRGGAGNSLPMQSLLTRVAEPSSRRAISTSNLSGSMRLQAAGAGSPRPVAAPLSPCLVAPAASACAAGGTALTPPATFVVFGNSAQEARSPPRPARRYSPPPHVPGCPMSARHSAGRALSPTAPLLVSHS